nr:S8 family serine peptidase [Patescibacteria group bacterium]
MKKLYIIIIIVSFLSLSLFSLSFANKEEGKNLKANSNNYTNFEKTEKDYVENEIIVKYRDDNTNLNTRSLSVQSFDNNDKERGIAKKEEYNNFDFALYEIRDGKAVEDKIEELKKDPNVLYAEPNYRRRLFDIGTNDQYGDFLWGLDNTGQNVNGISGTIDADIDWPEARGLMSTTSTSSVIVAVIDTGVAYNHPDLQDKMWDGSECVDETGTTISGGCLHGYDYENDNNDPSPNHQTHGTHVAGTIAASIDNSIGIVGVASNTKIMALEFDLTVSSEVKAIDFAIQNGAKIINASYGGYTFSQAEKDAIARFRDAGGLLIAAAGNGGVDGIGDNNDSNNMYPANYD